MRTFLVTTLVVSMICSPIVAQQQQITDQQQAIMDAERDAEQANTFLWIGAGILCGVFSIPIAYLAEPSVHPIKLVGKSPEYVAYYTMTYKQKVKNQQTLAATGGCLIWTAAYVLVIYPSMNTY